MGSSDHRLKLCRRALALPTLLIVAGLTPPRAAALKRPEVRSMLLAARRYADEDARKSKTVDIHLLLDISEEQYRAGAVEDARDSLRAATAAVHGSGDCPTSSILTWMAQIQWETGGAAEASATMKTVLEIGLRAKQKNRAQCLVPLALLQTRIGDLDAALRTAASIPDDRMDHLYPRIAEALARDGRLDEAVAAFAHSYPNPTEEEKERYRLFQSHATSLRERIASLKKINPWEVQVYYESTAENAALSGDFKAAGAALNRVENPGVASLENIVRSYARHGNLRDAMRTVESKLPKDPNGRSAVLLEIADLQDRTGDHAGAAATRKRALDISAKGQKEADTSRRFIVLAEEGRMDEAIKFYRNEMHFDAGHVVTDLWLNGHEDAARKLVDALGIGALEDSDSAVIFVLSAYVREGDFASLNRVLESKDRPLVVDNDEWLSKMAEAQARRGDIRGALAAIDRLQGGFFTKRPAAIESVAQAEMETAVWPQPPNWIAGLPAAHEKARAWLGAARGMRRENEKQDTHF